MKYYESNVDVMLGDRVTYYLCPGRVIQMPAPVVGEPDPDDYPPGILVIFENAAQVDFGDDISDTEDLVFVRRDAPDEALIEYLSRPEWQRAPYNNSELRELLPWPYSEFPPLEP